MKRFEGIVPALLIAVGIAVLGFCLKAGIDNFAFRDREVTASTISSPASTP